MDRVKNTDTIEEMIREYLSTEIPESKTVNNKIQQAYDEIQNPRHKHAKELAACQLFLSWPRLPYEKAFTIFWYPTSSNREVTIACQ